MARNVFSLKPRETQALREVELHLRKCLDHTWEGKEKQDDKPNIIINACNVHFSEDAGVIVAHIDQLEVMYTLANNSEYFLWGEQYMGSVQMKKHVVRDGKNRRRTFVYYTVLQVFLHKCEDETLTA